MNQSELCAQIAKTMTNLPIHQVNNIVKEIIEQLVLEVTRNGRVEIRGFGSFLLHYHTQRQARNPKTGDVVIVDSKYVPHFKPGKDLKERINHFL